MTCLKKTKQIISDVWHETHDEYADWEGVVEYEHRAIIEYGMFYAASNHPYCTLIHHEDMWGIMQSYEHTPTRDYAPYYKYRSNHPVFAVIGTEQSRRQFPNWMSYSRNCQHGLVCDLKPEFKELIRFHLWEQTGLPFNFVSNSLGLYRISRRWTNRVYGDSSEPKTAWQLFCENTLLNKDEKLPDIKTSEKLPHLAEWLESRKPFLKEQFHQAMTKWNIEFISEEEIKSHQHFSLVPE